MQTSFYHVGKITMDFFLGVQLHFTINLKNFLQKTGGTDKKHFGLCIGLDSLYRTLEKLRKQVFKL